MGDEVKTIHADADSSAVQIGALVRIAAVREGQDTTIKEIYADGRDVVHDGTEAATSKSSSSRVRRGSVCRP